MKSNSNQISRNSYHLVRNLLLLSLFYIVIVTYVYLYYVRIPLNHDELYYWVWSKNLQLSYYDHPPMVAYLIWLTNLFVTNKLMIRLSGIVCMMFTIYTTYKITCLISNKKAGLISILLIFTWPMTYVVFCNISPDAPLLLFYTLALYFF